MTDTNGATAPTTASQVMNATQERIMALLGSGFPPSVVAASVGCTEGYVSQCMSMDWFSSQVQEMKFLNLKKHTELDEKYDDLEDVLLEKLKKLVPLLVKPMDITRVLQTVNGAKRRGAGNVDPGIIQQNIVQLNIPPALFQKFVKNANNQVVEVQDGTGQQRTLVTAPSGSLERLSREVRETGELSESIRGTLLEGEVSDPESGPQETISPEALSQLANSRTLIQRLNESGRTKAPLTTEDL